MPELFTFLQEDSLIVLCSVQFSCSVLSNSLRPHGLQYARPPCPSPAPGAYSKSCPLSRWCHPAISSSVVPFSRLQSFPASGSLPVSQFFASCGQSIGVSASTSVLALLGCQKTALPIMGFSSEHFFLWSECDLFLERNLCVQRAPVCAQFCKIVFSVLLAIGGGPCSERHAYYSGTWHLGKTSHLGSLALTDSRRRRILSFHRVYFFHLSDGTNVSGNET